MKWVTRRTRRRTIETPALEGKTGYEMLYAAMARSARGYKCCIVLLGVIVVWDRIERWPLLAEKQYLPVVMAEHADGSARYVGEPDPTWRPSDRNVLDELAWTLQTLRGRTKDAQFDKQLWQRLYDHATERGRVRMVGDFEALSKTPEKGRITIRILSINKMSDTTFDVRWEERRENELGKVVGVPSIWRGLFTVVIEVPTTLEGLRNNIKGVWLDDWSIAEDKA
jgi:type IV secretory pathway TrbF-like protein